MLGMVRKGIWSPYWRHPHAISWELKGIQFHPLPNKNKVGPLDSHKNWTYLCLVFSNHPTRSNPGRKFRSGEATVGLHLPNSSKLQKDLVFWGGQNEDYNLLMLISPPGVLTQLVWRFVNQRMNKRKQTTIISNWWLFMIVILGGKGLNGYVAG